MSVAGKRARNTLCVYCGRRTMRLRLGVAVCSNHEDLPALDPIYKTPPDQWGAARK